MKKKRQVLQFLEDNYIMINSLMSDEEKRTFQGDVVGIIVDEIKHQIKEESGLEKK
jgi:hypothetical protein